MKIENLKGKLVTWLANKFGYQIAMYKFVPGDLPKKVPTMWIWGNIELIRYVDKVGYMSKLEPLKRDYKKHIAEFPERVRLEPVTLDYLKNIGIEVEPFTEEELKQTI